MDELTQVRELRADRPPVDPMTLARGRQRLNRATASGGGRGARFRALRTDWRFATVGAALSITVALTATAVVSADLGPNRSDGSRTAASAGTAAESSALLLRAAAALEARPTPPEPRDDQWVYTYTELLQSDVTQGTSAKGVRIERVWRPGTGPAAWTRYTAPEGTKAKGAPVYSPRDLYRAVDALPEDPAEALAAVRALFPTDGDPTVMGRRTSTPPEDETKAQHGLRAVGELLKTHPLPPSGQARLYRALATIPGIDAAEVRSGTEDRMVIAVGLKDTTATELPQVLLDQRDFGYAGTRIVAGEDHVIETAPDSNTPRQRIPAGTVLHSETRTAAAVVNKKGQTG
ncbi:CU044_5270 family protein [Streptomyces sp. NPDC005963]|uniref:CU044_5270 family protein n=1 Tax=Streptomyces sp. NPDC005963 TaxID=3156721 RepID=UPI0033C0D5B6